MYIVSIAKYYVKVLISNTDPTVHFIHTLYEFLVHQVEHPW